MSSFKSKRSKAIHWGGILIIILILLLAFGCHHSARHRTSDDTPPVEEVLLATDSDCVLGNTAVTTEDERKVFLNQKVEEGRMVISMNSNPVFESASSEGNLLIYNDVANRNPQRVQIILEEDQSLAYSSGLIPVGYSVPKDTLLVKLEPGNHSAIAVFEAVEEGSSTIVGKACAKIIITIH